MDNVQASIALGGGVALLLLIFLYPKLSFRDHSDREIHAACSEIFAEVEELASRKSTRPEWEQLRETALPRLEEFTKDIDKHPRSSTAASEILYQVVKFELPKALERRPARDVKGALALAKDLIDPPPPKLKRRAQPDRDRWDYVTIGLIVVDTLMAIGLVVYVVRR